MWTAHGLVEIEALPRCEREVLEETEDYAVVRTPLGAILKVNKSGSSIPQHIQEALTPTREEWRRFRTSVEANASRYAPNWREAAEALNQRAWVATFMAGSLFSKPREWMGVEQLSYLVYDDPHLYEEIIEHQADFFMTLYEPILRRVKFDFAYIFEDCCFSNGPLISPEVYRKYYHRHYRRMIDFYHEHGVEFVLVDSDGRVDDLLPCWLESGFDIVFPIEVGTWRADPREFRKRYGKRLRMMGGVNKHVIPQGEAEIRAHLEPLREIVAEGDSSPCPTTASHLIVPSSSSRPTRACSKRSSPKRL